MMRRSRQRAPKLRVGERLLCGCAATDSVLSQRDLIRKVAASRLRPSTLPTFDQAMVRGKYLPLVFLKRATEVAGHKGAESSGSSAPSSNSNRVSPRFG